MKKLIILLIIMVILIFGVQVNGLEVRQYDESNFSLTGSIIDQNNIDKTIEYASIINESLPDEFKDVEVLISSHRFESSIQRACAMKMSNGKYYIVLATKDSDFKTIARSLYHELGHVKQWQDNINKYEYSDFVYDNRYLSYTFMSGWEYDLDEEFAEDYMIWSMNKYYPEIEIEKTTARNCYESVFDLFIYINDIKKEIALL